MILDINSESHFEEVVNSTDELLLVKFSAPWCAPCRTLDPILDEVSQEQGVTILKVNVDELPELAGEFRIMSVPTTYFIKNKEALTMLNGAGSKETIVNLINEINEG